MDAEIHQEDIDKKYCCEELRLVVELDEEIHFSIAEESSGIPGTLNDLRNLKMCPFCGTPQ
jgi:hypothetical protein